MVRLPESSNCRIQFLVDCRFPDLNRRRASLVNRGRSAKNFTELQSRADQYRRELLGKSGAELDSLYSDEQAKIAQAALERAEQEESRRPFNQPPACANFGHWAKMSYWTPDEAVALSLGRDPNVANWPAVQQLVRVSRFASEYASRREIVMRAKAMRQLRDSTVPSVFLAWADRMDIPLPDGLVEAVKSLGNQIADWKSLYDRQKGLVEEAEKRAREFQELYEDANRKRTAFMSEMSENQDQLVAGYTSIIAEYKSKVEELQSEVDRLMNEKPVSTADELGVRERESLIKLTIGMAIGGYGYDPTAKRSDTASAVASDLQLVGLALSDDTIRKYLAEGRELLPRNETE